MIAAEISQADDARSKDSHAGRFFKISGRWKTSSRESFSSADPSAAQPVIGLVCWKCRKKASLIDQVHFATTKCSEIAYQKRTQFFPAGYYPNEVRPIKAKDTVEVDGVS